MTVMVARADAGYDPRPRIARGPNFVFIRDFVFENHGQATWDRALERLEPLDRAVWSGPPLATGRYPFEAFLALTRSLSEVTGISDRDELSEIYSYVADRSLNSIYRFFLRWSQPAFVISNYPSLWRRFFEEGEVEVPESEPGHARLCFRVPEMFGEWLPPACLGYSRKAIELAGGREVRLEEEGHERTQDGGWKYCYQLSWKQ